MRKLQVGDKVRFLNTVGGGQVKSFLNKQLVIVEEENGFDIPVLISECVVVETAGNEKLGQPAPEPSSKEPEPVARIEAAEPVTETIEGEKITTCLLFLPVDARNMTQTSFECYFVNDSNYFLFLNYMSRENNSWKSRYNGIVEPNTQIFIEEFDKSQLNDLESLCPVRIVQAEQNIPVQEPCFGRVAYRHGEVLQTALLHRKRLFRRECAGLLYHPEQYSRAGNGGISRRSPASHAGEESC